MYGKDLCSLGAFCVFQWICFCISKRPKSKIMDGIVWYLWYITGEKFKEVQILEPQVHFCSYCFEPFKKTSISTELDFWVLVFVHILLIFLWKKKINVFLNQHDLFYFCTHCCLFLIFITILVNFFYLAIIVQPTAKRNK